MSDLFGNHIVGFSTSWLKYLVIVPDHCLLFTLQMETTNKQQLRNLHSRLGTLLAQKKALNSKVTSKHFDLFREAAESVSTITNKNEPPRGKTNNVVSEQV